jgi:hypothetical protein
MTVGNEWYDNEETILLWEQPTTAVFLNGRNHLVIRQRGEVFEDDPFVTFELAHLPTLIRRLEGILEEAEFDPAEHDQKLLRSVGIDPETGGQLKKRVLSSAERQRRYKQRVRQGDGDDEKGDAGVTEKAVENDGRASPMLPLDPQRLR